MSNDLDESDYRPRQSRRGSNIDIVRTDEKVRWKVVRRQAPPKFVRNNPETAIQDIELMIDTKNVVFGAYGADDWLTNTAALDALKANKNVLALEGTWLVPASFKLLDWVLAHTTRYHFMTVNRAFLFQGWGHVEVVFTRGKIELSVHGDPEEVQRFVELIDSQLKRAENLIEWVYGQRGNTISVPLNYKPAIKGSYPWLPMPLEQYIDAYLASTASVLILIGPPGTGKTTFIKNMIHRSGGNAKVTYDDKVMSDDSLFAGFVQSDTRFMIMEDADAFLKSRTEGNTMMHRFLNVSDGLVSAEGKKLVFSTNLPSVRDIDEALMRPGRCYDVVTFRALTRSEATVVAGELGVELPDGSEFKLAELFNTQLSEKVSRPLGFIS